MSSAIHAPAVPSSYVHPATGQRMPVPRGAIWAAEAFAWVHKALVEIGRARARRELLRLAQAHQSTNPSMAADLRAAAYRDTAGQ